MQQEYRLGKRWPQSQLLTAINSLVYGVNCLYFERQSQKLLYCKLFLHEQYINILHVVIENKCSILFQLHTINNISDHDLYVRQSLKAINYQHFFNLYTSSLGSHTLVMLSENEKNVMWEGLQFFIHEAKMFYHRISEMDPFKAEATMLFLEADTDGSNLLDIGEIMSIFKRLKITKSEGEILEHIAEINNDLYEKQNLKKPKKLQNDQLTPLGFEYLLKYYSIKSELAPRFTEFCHLFKFKHKNLKKSIIDILKSQQKPLMSGIQLSEFIQTYMKDHKTEDYCTEFIKTFPIYDGEGKEIPEECELLSFNNFCNFIFTVSNSLMDPQKSKQYQDMNKPLNEYYIYTSQNTYLSGNKPNSDPKLEMYEMSLKKGCRCVQIDIYEKNEEFIVKNKFSQSYIMLEDVLRTIKNVGFTVNPYPIILMIDIACDEKSHKRLAVLFQEVLDKMIFTIRNKEQIRVLPSPEDLRGRIILCSINILKKNQETPFTNKMLLSSVRLDFQRKGQNAWSCCNLNESQIKNHEQIEKKNLVDYGRKIFIRSYSEFKKEGIENLDSQPLFRNGLQFISVNTQIQDQHQYFLHSRFLENGGCGYLLKPVWMMGFCMQSRYDSDFMKQTHIVKLLIQSGQKCILKNLESVGEFWLQVSIKGTKQEEKNNKFFQSEPQTEGFYTTFNLNCEFNVFCYELACIQMNIVTKNNCILASRTIPVITMRQGLRTVQLLGEGMSLIDNSFLLVQYEKLQVEKSKRVYEFRQRNQ